MRLRGLTYLLLLILAVPANAQTGQQCGPPDGGPASCEANGAASQSDVDARAASGNPINLITGNKYQREDDLPPLPGVLGLEIVRHYNSAQAKENAPNGLLGRGWRLSYETELYAIGNTVQIMQADGRLQIFSKDPKNSSLCAGTDPAQGTIRIEGQGAFTVYDWKWPNGRTLRFGAGGKLERITALSGETVKLQYTPGGRLIRVTDPQGRELQLEYADQRGDHFQGIKSLHSPVGVYEYRYEDRSARDRLVNLTAVIDPDGNVRRYHYEDSRQPGFLTGILAGSKHGALTRIARYAYDIDGAAIYSAHGSDIVRLDRKPDATIVTDGAGRITTFKHAIIGNRFRILEVRGAGCPGCSPANRRYRYDDLGRTIEETKLDRSGQAIETTRTSRDGQGRISGVESIDSVEGKTQGPQLLWRYEYAGLSDRPVRIVGPSVNPASNYVVGLAADSKDHLAIVETGFSPRPDGSFLPVLRRIRVDEQRGGNTYIRRGDGNALEETRITHDSQGLLRNVSLPDGGSLSVTKRDDAGRPVRVETDSGAALDLGYNARGEIVRIANAHHRVQRRSFSVAPTVSARMNDDPLTDARAPRTSISVSDARGNVTRYGVDDFGRRVFVMSPDAGTTQYEYDQTDRLLTKTAPAGETARYQYVPGGRLQSVRLPDWTVGFLWERIRGQQRLKRVGNPADNESLRYDDAGRLIERTHAIGQQLYSARYRYDAQGRLTEKTLPSGRRLRYTYHQHGSQAGRLASIAEVGFFGRTVPLLTLSEASDANAQEWTSGNGIATRWRRKAGRLERLHISGLHDFRYDHDAAGRIVSIDNSGLIDQRYRYDREGRLDLAITPEALFGYHYDTNGNRTREVVNGHTTFFTYASDSNRLTSLQMPDVNWHPPMKPLPNVQENLGFGSIAMLPETRVRYRSDGSIRQLGKLHLRYDSNGQLESVDDGQQPQARYRYNSRGERAAKIRYATDGRVLSQHQYLYENRRLVAEADAEGRIEREYLYLGRYPVAVMTAGAAYAIHTNHLGAPIAVTDQKREVIWRARYEPFGWAKVDEDPDGDGQAFTLNLRLPGQYADAESGLFYNDHRYYDSAQGRYVSSDPLGLLAGMNPYVYAANDPINFIDPTGLLLFAFDGTGNSDPPQEKSDYSNVVKFRDSYISDSEELATQAGTHHYYISGAGTTDRDSGISGGTTDAGSGHSIDERVIKMGDYLVEYLLWMEQNGKKETALNLDVVGFSRGAASARMFVNLIHDYLNGERNPVIVGGEQNAVINSRGEAALAYLKNACVKINLRFLGLFDTVPHYDLANQDDDLQQLKLGIPDEVGYVAHAVAVNENRKDFHGISIHQNPATSNSETRMELGFIGAHSDIGGGYAEGDLSDVALMWMVQRAEGAGVSMDQALMGRKGWNIVNSPVLHDSVGVRPSRLPYSYSPGRNFKYLNGQDQVAQQQWDNGGMNAETALDEGFYDIRYAHYGSAGFVKGTDYAGDKTWVGVVDGKQYSQWLKENYGMDIDINERKLNEAGFPNPARP